MMPHAGYNLLFLYSFFAYPSEKPVAQGIGQATPETVIDSMLTHFLDTKQGRLALPSWNDQHEVAADVLSSTKLH